MPFDIFSTHTLLKAVRELAPLSTFLRDRYFPTNDTTDIFATDDVLVEYKSGNKKLAPFVAPRKGGLTITRDGHTMERYSPPFIAPRRTLTLDDLKKRGFGEALYPDLAPDQRQATMLLRDVEELGVLISRREEAMAAEVLLTNGCIMKHYADDMTKYDEKKIFFYDGTVNPSVYTVTKSWDEVKEDEDTSILNDLGIMLRILTSRGLPGADLLCAPDVADAIMFNPAIKKLLDIKNLDIGKVDPTLIKYPSVARVAVLNVKGHMINIISYDETYESEAGADTQYIPAGHAILTAPGVGRTLYGAVSQVEQSDGEFHTYAGRRVPKYLSNADGNTRSLTITSCPLLIPNNKDPWVTAKVIL